MVFRKLPKPITKTLQSSSTLLPPIPNSNLINKPEPLNIPLPTVSLSQTSQQELLEFLKSHLKPSFTPHDLFNFLHKKLHYHPRFTQFDVHIFRWASEIDAFRHDHFTYEWMVRTLAITDRFDDLNSILEGMVSNPCPCSDGIFSCDRTEVIFRFAINAYCKLGRLDDALIAFGNMRKLIDGKPSVILYNIMINGFVRYREHDKALQFYDKMVKDRVKPDVYTFNTLISSYYRNSQFCSALELFKEMKVKGCNPNVVSFNTLIKGFFRSKKFKEGIEMAYEMLDLGFEFSDVTCDILFAGLCRENRMSEASKLFIDIFRKNAIPDRYDCLDIVQGLCLERKMSEALELVGELLEKGKILSPVICTTLIDSLLSSGMVEDAFVLMEKMLKLGIVPDSVTYNCVLREMCGLGRTMDANRLRLLASTNCLDPDGMTYNILVSGFSREGRKEEGEALVEMMLDEGFIPDLATYNRLLSGLSAQNKTEVMRRTCQNSRSQCELKKTNEKDEAMTSSYMYLKACTLIVVVPLIGAICALQGIGLV